MYRPFTRYNYVPVFLDEQNPLALLVLKITANDIRRESPDVNPADRSARLTREDVRAVVLALERLGYQVYQEGE